MTNPFAPIARVFARAIDSLRNPQRPPEIAVVFPCDEGRALYCTDVQYAAMIALAQGRPTLDFVQLRPRFWHLAKHAIPAHAWKPWKTLTTGDFLQRVERAGVKVGTYHKDGVAALVRQGYMQTEAQIMVRTARAS